MSARGGMPQLIGMRSADMRLAEMPPPTPPTHATNHPSRTLRVAWAKLMARVGEEFPLEYPMCGCDIRLISFITEPGPIRKVLTHLGEPLEPRPTSPALGPPADWGELGQVRDLGRSTPRRA
jgi:hypothetical protein